MSTNRCREAVHPVVECWESCQAIVFMLEGERSSPTWRALMQLDKNQLQLSKS